NKKGYYTLSDRGIWTWADPDKKSDLKIFCEGGDTNPDDILLNPCLAITLQDAPEGAQKFYEWLTGDGQNYVEQYTLHNGRLYSKAPDHNFYPCRTS
ncbi:MAG: hypothetical protein HRT68_10460, partial [Flavobacteriaceae bacterium]|nr:hypothetical protein [Flavobacteriaceae bacterium]